MPFWNFLGLETVETRAVEVGFKKPSFLDIKNLNSQKVRFLIFF